MNNFKLIAGNFEEDLKRGLYKSVKVAEQKPFDHCRDTVIPTLKGAKIVDIRMTIIEGKFADSESDWPSYGSGGLTIVAEKDGKVFHLVLGYTELGEWVDALFEESYDG